MLAPSYLIRPLILNTRNLWWYVDVTEILSILSTCFLQLFGCDFTSLWQTANQKRCHALLRTGRLVEVFEAYRYMAEMSDETTRAGCLNWSIGKFRIISPRLQYLPYLTQVSCKNCARSVTMLPRRLLPQPWASTRTRTISSATSTMLTMWFIDPHNQHIEKLSYCKKA